MSQLFLSIPPEEQRQKFLSLKHPRDIANLLEYDYKYLTYYLYKFPDKKKYITFDITKRTGGKRQISSPTEGLKFLQRKLNEVLLNVYTPSPVVYGFVPEKNIVLNAKRHKRKSWVLNIDIQRFFPSINFGRVRGMFMGKPYNLPDNIATVLAQICCYNNELPQGAPTSPIVSNMICAKLDSELQDFAWKNRCFYTRYADDMTFSTTLPELPQVVGKIDLSGKTILGKELRQIIEGNGFLVNEEKVRLLSSKMRQEVTGLTVNRFPNVRRSYIQQIRAMLHAWDKYSLFKAEQDHYLHFRKKHRNPGLQPPSFRKIVKGKIDFLGLVRGKSNPNYLKFKTEYIRLLRRDKNIPGLKYADLDNLQKPHIFVEGPTDVKILQTAWIKLYGEKCPYLLQDSHPTRNSDPSHSGGGTEALSDLLKATREDNPYITIGIFDNDQDGRNHFDDLPKNYIYDNVTDFKIAKSRKSGAILLPIPSEKQKYADYQNLCIEFYFSEEVLNKKSNDGRGLSFSFPPMVTTVGRIKIDTKEQNTILETRKIQAGKMIFASEIVPSLDEKEFEFFRLLFDKLNNLINSLEIE